VARLARTIALGEIYGRMSYTFQAKKNKRRAGQGSASQKQAITQLAFPGSFGKNVKNSIH
jgi:organic hydroperoxide reductase OsmC/OhrA